MLKSPPYNVGERAGFPDAVARDLVARGVAELVTPEVAEPEPAPGGETGADAGGEASQLQPVSAEGAGEDAAGDDSAAEGDGASPAEDVEAVAAPATGRPGKRK